MNLIQNFICFLFRKTCGFCQKLNPVKKCSKSHSRCKGILFCNKNCEISSHKKQKEDEENQKKPSAEEEESEENENVNGTKVMSEAAKVEKAKLKKAKKAANKVKKSGDGGFWWNNGGEFF